WQSLGDAAARAALLLGQGRPALAFAAVLPGASIVLRRAFALAFASVDADALHLRLIGSRSWRHRCAAHKQARRSECDRRPRERGSKVLSLRRHHGLPWV